MSEIDWDKAPEGATHWELESYGASAGWMRNDGGEWFFLSSEGRWLKHIISNVSAERLANMIKRPSPAWSGKCLPPAGVVCEWEHEANKGAWHKAEIKYIGSAYVIVADFAGIEQHYYLRSMKFRPIRTPEQIAAAEREAAVNGMLCYDALGGSRRGLAEALYDAGYRKQEVNDAV